MDPTRFDTLVRTLSEPVSRRRTITAAALVAFGITRRGDEAAAGPGCKNVGKKCDKDKDCCSGICKGKKGKEKCKAHDTGGCGKGEGGICGGRGCTTSAGDEGECFKTTGNAGYCLGNGDCFNCKEDKDCRPLCGQKAACVVCTSECQETGGRACAGNSETACGGM